MSTRTLLLSAGLLIACGAASSQPPTVAPPPGVHSPGLPPPGVIPPVPVAPSVVVPTPPPEKNVEQLIDELERLHAQKAELDKREQELKATLRKKLEKQTERLDKLGVSPKEAKRPDRVGRIIINGNTKTPTTKILEKVKLGPGQVMNYPALEETRTVLERAGFRGVKVEVVPGDLDPAFKDIQVTVEEPATP